MDLLDVVANANSYLTTPIVLLLTAVLFLIFALILARDLYSRLRCAQESVENYQVRLNSWAAMVATKERDLRELQERYDLLNLTKIPDLHKELSDLKADDFFLRMAALMAVAYLKPRRKMYRWVAVKLSLRMGSTSAQRVCKLVNLDPDELIGGRKYKVTEP